MTEISNDARNGKYFKDVQSPKVSARKAARNSIPCTRIESDAGLKHRSTLMSAYSGSETSPFPFASSAFPLRRFFFFASWRLCATF